MKFNKIKSRFTTLGIILLFIFSAFSTIFVVNVSAEWIELEEDGIWFDEFNNTDSIHLDSNCVYNSGSDGYILLGEGSPSYEYNFSGQSENTEVWDYVDADLDTLGVMSLFVSPSHPGASITDKTELDKLKYIDKTNIITTQSNKNQDAPRKK